MSQRSGAFSLKKLPDGKTLFRSRSANLFIAGVGAVGSTLIKQINTLDERRYDLRIVGLCNSSKVKWRDETAAPDELYGGKRKNWNEIFDHLRDAAGLGLPVIFVDATGSREVAERYLDILRSGAHLVTPSKIANSMEQHYFEQIRNEARKRGLSYRYETTVGAGLPVLHSIESLVETGDEIVSVSGVLSGTMTYLFHELENGTPFSRAVIQARSLGYAEPDPRDDLSGEDVARKFLIIARTCGRKLERSELEVESLIPGLLKDVPANEFLARLSEFDQHWSERIELEKRENRTLRYTGRFGDGNVRVGIESVPLDEAIGQLGGTNNLIEIRTRRYYDQPLVIRGPGAGKEVTAAGVLADIQQIVRTVF